jgi:hypothetical protein
MCSSGLDWFEAQVIERIDEVMNSSSDLKGVLGELPTHLLPAAERFRKLADRIAEKQNNAFVDRLAHELHQAFSRGRKEARREVRKDMYALGGVDNAARRLLLAIDHGQDLAEAIEQLRRTLAKSPGVTPYPLESVKLDGGPERPSFSESEPR